MRAWVLVVALAGLTACQPKASGDDTASSAASASETVGSAWSTLPSSTEAGTSSEATLPAEVAAFIDKRDGCEHWLGEPAFDADRAKQINDAVKDVCEGTDAALAKLRTKYKDDPAVIAALADYTDVGM